MQLSRFRIDSLHGQRTVDLPIVDNQLVLVGENGSGKSTVANILYLFLTRQWLRLQSLDIRAVSAVIDGATYEFRPSDLGEALPAVLDSLSRRLSPGQRSDLLAEWLHSDPTGGEEAVWRLMSRAIAADLPTRLIEQSMRSLRHSGAGPELGVLRELDGRLRDLAIAPVLYLPTYRRIEQDLGAIFPGHEEEISRLRQTSGRDRHGLGSAELVEFGMGDVQENVKATMNKLKDHFLTELNNLTGEYLRDVIRRVYSAPDLLPKLQTLDDGTLDSILSRIPKTLLTDTDQDNLRDTVARVRGSTAIGEHDKVVAHFLVQLLGVHEKQQSKETEVRRFVEVCNQYLFGKRLVYDDASFAVVLQVTDGGRPEERALQWADLSSGEKQIVSLFSHLYLSEGTRFFVIIDEPEMSLSVPWQRRFLPDLLETGLCEGLVAATHSPFIFDNILDRYTFSLEEFVRSSDELP